MSIQQKYNTRAAALYRDKISTLAQGKPWSEETSNASNYSSSFASDSQKHSSSRNSNSQRSSMETSKSYQDLGDASNSYQNFNTREFRDQKESFFNRIQEENASRPEYVEIFRFFGLFFNQKSFVLFTVTCHQVKVENMLVLVTPRIQCQKVNLKSFSIQR